MDIEEERKNRKESASEFPYWCPVRRRFEPESPFFSSGNIERELLAKHVALDVTEDERRHLQDIVVEQNGELFCPIVDCHARLASMENFEDHYNARHTASCSVCAQAYPTSRLLSIHVSEVHDSFFQAKVARGYAVYECLVEGCGLKFKTYKGRQQHLVDKHKFPSSFEFYKKAHPSKKQRQKIERKHSSHGRETPSNMMDVEDEAINGLISAVSKLSTSDSSPKTVSFGRHSTRGFTFVPRSIQRGRRSE